MKKITEGYKETELGVIPQEWEVSKLGDIGSFRKGKGIKKDEVIEKGLPCLRYGEIYTSYDYKFNKTKSFISEETAESSIHIQKGNIVFAGSGETVEDIGKAIVYLGDVDCYVGGDTIIMKPNKYIDGLYLSYFFGLSLVTKQKRKLGQGNAIVHIYLEGIKKIIVTYPPLPEQQKIAEILSSVDEHIEKLDGTISEYELLKKGMMKKLLTEGIGHTEFKDSEIGRIPKDWEVRKFFDTIDTFMDYRGRTPKKLGMDWGNGDILALSALNVKMGYIDFSLEPKFSSVELYNKWMTKSDLEKNDILMTMEAPLGNIALVPDDRKYILSQRVVALKTKPFIENTYLAYYLMGERFQSSLWSSATGSTAKGISQKNLEKLSVAIPTKDEQEQIASILSSIDNRIDLYKSEKKDFVQVKKGLMEKLLTGKIRV